MLGIPQFQFHACHLQGRLLVLRNKSRVSIFCTATNEPPYLYLGKQRHLWVQQRSEVSNNLTEVTLHLFCLPPSISKLPCFLQLGIFMELDESFWSPWLGAGILRHRDEMWLSGPSSLTLRILPRPHLFLDLCHLFFKCFCLAGIGAWPVKMPLACLDGGVCKNLGLLQSWNLSPLSKNTYMAPIPALYYCCCGCFISTTTILTNTTLPPWEYHCFPNLPTNHHHICLKSSIEQWLLNMQKKRKEVIFQYTKDRLI